MSVRNMIRLAAWTCLLLPISACNSGFLYETAGDFGVQFEKDSGCITVDTSKLSMKAPFSFDVYLQANDDQGAVISPIVIWPNSFGLFQDAAGLLVLGWEEGARKVPIAVMDGEAHHIAWTNDSGGGTRLFVDGESVYTGTANLLGSPTSSLFIGCWPAQNAWFSGVIGEVSFHKGIQWDVDFEPEWVEHEITEDSLAIWRLNEGRGTSILDDNHNADGTLEGGEWVPFALEGTRPGQDGSDSR